LNGDENDARQTTVAVKTTKSAIRFSFNFHFFHIAGSAGGGATAAVADIATTVSLPFVYPFAQKVEEAKEQSER